MSRSLTVYLLLTSQDTATNLSRSSLLSISLYQNRSRHICWPHTRIEVSIISTLAPCLPSADPIPRQHQLRPTMSSSTAPSQSGPPPPSWLADTSTASLVGVTSVMLPLATALLGLRLYSRHLTKASRGWDEFLLPPAYLGLVGLVVINYRKKTQCLAFLLLIQYPVAVSLAGAGQHVEMVAARDPSQLRSLFIILYSLDWFYVPSNMMSRASVVLLYLRVFTSKFTRACSWLTLAFLVANCVATIIAAQLECRPLAYSWDKTIPGGTCFNVWLWYQLTNFPNVIADVAILVLPIPTIWHLKASTGRKAGIALVCLTGSM